MSWYRNCTVCSILELGLGVDVVKKLVETLFESGQTPKAGSLVLALGNPKGIKLNQRYVESDLNRCFNPDDLSKPLADNATYEEKRSRDFAEFVAEAHVLIDVHATLKPSDPFVRIGGVKDLNLNHEEILDELIGCNTLLLDPLNLIGMGRPVCSDELLSYNGNTGICYETGFAGDLECAPRVLASMIAILLNKLGLEIECEEAAAVQKPATKPVRDVYEMTSVFTLGEEGFRWNSPYGSHNFQKIPGSVPIGFHGETPLVEANDTYVIFPKVPELWFLGKPLGWLAKKL
ncbi:hypothetical protein SARC_08255 [Sphaeroforma arctica JP610]|uniref:Succinylglutamate desuccinylase/Aspartoacylase catalytic domain-containing protein n=1 Tax=Sphaeroforma arctica JP610 TaxID=667725 RepID=A0A0L0FRN3_9EUKA|nr:hypothetical protein SARC_08255 [Sphaeroforma arctica JP610]KNC79349.1 hypothetical protein SARC_08255 [Sphaeroforma arctica JP610]|eukprot:XP_014153251.1 hypothetical protein SARC_08255 [Sphaeroforma arctica JP610]